MSKCIVCGRRDCSPVKLAIFGNVNGEEKIIGYASVDCWKKYDAGEVKLKNNS